MKFYFHYQNIPIFVGIKRSKGNWTDISESMSFGHWKSVPELLLGS
jgi:hypothetical protein